MSNPVNDGYVRLLGTAAGTVAVMNYAGNLNSITNGTATTGTAIFYDSSGTAMGTAASRQMFAVTGTPVLTYKPEVHTKNGVVVVVSGTVDMLLGVG